MVAVWYFNIRMQGKICLKVFLNSLSSFFLYLISILKCTKLKFTLFRLLKVNEWDDNFVVVVFTNIVRLMLNKVFCSYFLMIFIRFNKPRWKKWPEVYKLAFILCLILKLMWADIFESVNTLHAAVHVSISVLWLHLIYHHLWHILKLVNRSVQYSQECLALKLFIREFYVLVVNTIFVAGKVDGK